MRCSPVGRGAEYSKVHKKVQKTRFCTKYVGFFCTKDKVSVQNLVFLVLLVRAAARECSSFAHRCENLCSS